MSAIIPFTSQTPFDKVVSDIREKGWSITDDFFSDEMVDALMMDISELDNSYMKQAGVGRSSDHQVALNRRSDYIRWIDPITPARSAFLSAMSELRLEFNRRLFLGLWDYEAHFARYEEGAFYEKHVDAFKGKSNRVLSTVLYLNENWAEGDGGELVLFDECDETVELGRYFPLKGRLAVFLSEEFPHEVLTAQRTRHSIAGWFRVNNSIQNTVDPDQ
ncbi:2OG-Fe(II) oxygenase [Marinomonas fungiae]|uniref:Proline 4-hydroxylase (Includes Rps23 Pro-64 3,4-dihydroxylase Tpa1), contains SM-20 domain n=1 Tax=Marinomonas fungiae TaxID=1137284 RepID=A0A0K6ILR5_9GAMM|nr:2OG-Fe(II) oxygenase [Marinomonas fungiae]CUB04034.1 Proline 4-hydroxylase (includes Rps23 Pro-64 3,4-dihydroxylase Tpa1), contains SM-20 domain [Marinomonas fungiae]